MESNSSTQQQQFNQPLVVDRNSRGLLGARPNSHGLLGARPNSRGLLGARPEMNRGGQLQHQFDQPPVVDSGFKSQPSSPMRFFKSLEMSIEEANNDLYKVPTGDSPYVKAKDVQLIDREPSKAISLFWSAIYSGDRVDSALKNMAIVMKQLDPTDKAIEAVESVRYLCSPQYEESLDNVLIDLYKRSGRIDEHIELLQHKLKLVEEGSAFGGKRTKIARSQGRKFHVSIEQERSRLLGSLAWAYMQQENYDRAEQLYREALVIEPDKNSLCNLAICLMKSKNHLEAKSLLQSKNLLEAKSLLQAVTPSSEERKIPASYIKSYDRALKTLAELENGDSVED